MSARSILSNLPLIGRLFKTRTLEDEVAKKVAAESDSTVEVKETPKYKAVPRGSLIFVVVFITLTLAAITYVKGTQTVAANKEKAQKADDSKYTEDTAEQQRVANTTQVQRAIEQDKARVMRKGKQDSSSSSSDFSAARPQSVGQGGGANPQTDMKPTAGQMVTYSKNPDGQMVANPVQSGSTPTARSQKNGTLELDSSGRPLPPPPPLSGTSYNPKPITNTNVIQGSDSVHIRGAGLIVLEEKEESSSTAPTQSQRSPRRSVSSPLTPVLVGD